MAIFARLEFSNSRVSSRGKVNSWPARRRVGARGCHGGRNGARRYAGEARVDVSSTISIASSIATDACCNADGPDDAATFSAACLRRVSLPLSLSLALALSSPDLGSFPFGKRFSPFLPRDRTLTLRRRSRGVENTRVYSEKGRDGCFAFLSIDCGYRYFGFQDVPLSSSLP